VREILFRFVRIWQFYCTMSRGYFFRTQCRYEPTQKGAGRSVWRSSFQWHSPTSHSNDCNQPNTRTSLHTRLQCLMF